MKLSNETITLMLETANLATMLGVEALILDAKGIRGYNDDDGIIVAAFGDHGFEFEAIGLARLATLKQKFKLLESLDSYTVSAEMKGDTAVIEKLVFDGGKVNFEFRCALPKNIRDIPGTQLNTKALYHFDVTKDDVDMITKGIAAMRSKIMVVQATDGKVRFRFSDETGDILNFNIDSSLATAEDINKLSITMNIRKMLPIFKRAVQDGDFRLNILKNNIMHITIGITDVLVMPEV